MPRFSPFAGVRYASPEGILDHLVAPPYDVVSPEDRAVLAARDPHNAILLELPESYDDARRLWDQWMADGTLRRDDPSFYVYRMTYADETGASRSTTGVLGALELVPPGPEGGILPHERTTPKAKTDRLELLRATAVNLSPIWGLSLAPGLSELCAPEGPPVARADVDGVLHELWLVDRPEIARAVASAPVVVADGHHRYEVGLTYRADNEAADAILAYVVELAEDELSVRAIHRLLTGLPDGFDLRGALSRHFDVVATGPADATILTRMVDAGALALVAAGGTWLLRPTEATVRAADQDLDSSRLEVALASLPAHEVAYQHGWDNVAAAVAAGTVDAGILLRPATVAQIAATGHGGDRMPPKTTFFHPKPRTGLVFREAAPRDRSVR